MTQMRTRLVATIGVALALWPFPPDGPGQAAASQTSGEELFVPPLNGWRVLRYREHLGTTELTELLPADQTERDWSQMLTIEVLTGKPIKSPPDLLTDQMTEIKTQCDDFGAGPIAPGMNNGYETALRAVACTRLKGWTKGEVHLYKVLHGREANYLVSRAWRGPPFDKSSHPLPVGLDKEWVNFMDQVVLCDLNDVARPCPTALSKTPVK